MSSVCFYFQVHQPYRIQKFTPFDIGQQKDYFNDVVLERHDNRHILDKVSSSSYLPTNRLLLKMLQENPEFKISFSLSGVFLEQIETWRPDVLESFQDLYKTGRVEILGETYYHSLAFIFSKKEFRAQVEKHRAMVERLFGASPTVFRNTELMFHNDLAHELDEMGYLAVITEGADHILEDRSPHFLYSSPSAKNLKIIPKSYRLSDDIAFRFSDQNWSHYPLTAPKFADWVNNVHGNGEIVGLFMDYESFGEHQWESSGIFNFLEHFPGEVLKHPDTKFVTPHEAATTLEPRDVMDVPDWISWADAERDLSAWRSNPMQHDALEKVYAIEDRVLKLDDPEITEAWRRMQTSDHFYYMCTKYFTDGDIHAYFSPYENPYQAFMYYMNAFRDLSLQLETLEKRDGKDDPLVATITSSTFTEL